MTTYISGQAAFGSLSAQTLDVIELRVISSLLQAQSQGGGGVGPDQLSTLRNDESFGLGITPPVVPGN